MQEMIRNSVMAIFAAACVLSGGINVMNASVTEAAFEQMA
ncbi:hypothetical protein GCM10010990_19340 [Croceicoccus mobilis]|uniref:Uncharacterized protein n=1 Tax=Croceicoccus mobilis TaxID=1703339 RepID=A0A917DUF5_9SPHN|nr:hypothetical protein GCM10010990_19340 [Croceicoccus mobilis]